MNVLRFHRAAGLAPCALLLALAALPAAAADGPQWQDGKQLYDKLCGHCHKPQVGVGPLLEGRVLPVEYLKVIVRNGFNAMPAFPETHVDDASLARLGAYLETVTPPGAHVEARP